jgi:hypothetical protein
VVQKMAHGIILSKDRPAQAHLCLESITKNDNGLFGNLSVLYTYSNPLFKIGYDELAKAFPKVTFVDQINYYEDIQSLVSLDYNLTSFFTDDDIMYSPLPLLPKKIFELFENYEDVLSCLSLRLGMNTVIQDPYIQSQTVPPTSGFHGTENYIVFWRWQDCPPYMNFGYPMSVDGHIFRTTEIKRVLEDCKFNNPNQQEIAMSSKANELKDLMSCFNKSVIVNTPINRVQDTCMNRAGEAHGQTPEAMNAKYLEGYRLDLNSLDDVEVVGCHQEIDIQWTTK